jgi:hypothetical protein
MFVAKFDRNLSGGFAQDFDAVSKCALQRRISQQTLFIDSLSLIEQLVDLVQHMP